MKRIFSLLATTLAVLVLASASFATTPDQEKAFIDAYKKAFESKDAATLEGLLYTKGANPDALEFYKMMMTSDMGGKITKIELRNLTPEEVKEAAEVMPGPDGTNSKLPVTPVKKLVMNIESGTGDAKSSSVNESFVGEVDGKLMIPVPATVK